MRAEIERLKSERDAANARIMAQANEWRMAYNALAAERDALREALEGVHKYVLVIESAVRNSDPSQHRAVLDVLMPVSAYFDALRRQGSGS